MKFKNMWFQIHLKEKQKKISICKVILFKYIIIYSILK